ncbi:MAG: hypothetical protein IJM83_04735 [Firmicutes bacterium]|nr:hypothetical protein [Bacillota bacterium]
MSQESVIRMRLNELETRIDQIQKTIKNLPAGILKIDQNGPYVKWYVLNRQKEGVRSMRTYLPKHKLALAKKLALKTYYAALLEDLKTEQIFLKKTLKQEENALPANSAEKLLQDQAFRELLPPEIRSVEEEIHDWQNAEYARNPYMPQELKVPTLAGISVRSKSEAIIADSLFERGILFRYEPGIILNDGRVVYPDFMVRNRYTQLELPWEHLGLMDDPAYIAKNTEKLQRYSASGYTPMVNLILTFETRTHPLSRPQVMHIIDQFLL